MVDLLTEEQLDRYRDVFGLFDKDGDGILSTQETCNAIRSLKKSPPTSELNEAFADAGTIDFATFLTFMVKFQQKNLPDNSTLLNAFKAFDDDKSGKISTKKLKYLLKN